MSTADDDKIVAGVVGEKRGITARSARVDLPPAETKWGYILEMFELGDGPVGTGQRQRHCVWFHALRAGGYRWCCSCGVESRHTDVSAALFAEARTHFEQPWQHMTTYIEGLLAKTRWRQEFNKRGYERRLPVASERLAETLRAELRAILDNDGKPFDLLVARRLYDFAIAAKDLLTVSATSVGDAIKVVADNGGAMESLTGADPVPAEVASETFGARILRELFATLHKSRDEDPLAIVAAIADARARGMHELAAKLEQRLIGTPLEATKITRAEVVHDSYEHGFIEGSMKANFDQGTINGVIGRDPDSWSPAYRAGFEAGQARRQPASPVLSQDISPAQPPRASASNGHGANGDEP